MWKRNYEEDVQCETDIGKTERGRNEGGESDETKLNEKLTRERKREKQGKL